MNTYSTSGMQVNAKLQPAFLLALSTFCILALELALIRWMGGQVRIMAYFSNLVLLATFLGMGLGVALGRRTTRLFPWLFPWLLVITLVLTFSSQLSLMHMKFPDATVSLWGAEGQNTEFWGFIRATLVVLALFWGVAGVFLCAGIPVGYYFNQLSPLTAYSADLAGSLLGVLATTLAAALGTPPVFWVGIGLVPFLVMTRRWWVWPCTALILLAVWYSGKGALFSPYNRIDVHQFNLMEKSPQTQTDWELSVNRDFHQNLLDLSSPAVEGLAPAADRKFVKYVYELPFRVQKEGATALVVGAGTGNDVAAALRCKYSHVVSIEIDPVIMKMGRELHPEKPYASPNVHPVINDARAYFEQNHSEKFDVVCYGLLDSHAMFSAMSTLRLDNYVYTVEGLRAGWNHVSENGIMSVSFSTFAGPWITQRMYDTIKTATGQTPFVVSHNYNYGTTFLVGKMLTPEQVKAVFPVLQSEPLPNSHIRIPTDDWPYLYLRPGSIPYAYIVVLLGVCLTAIVAVRAVYGREMFTAAGFHPPLFMMGAGFMLLETRMVTELSLLFGSTWLVNSSVFGGILVMVLIANIIVSRFTPKRPELWYIPLIASLLITWGTGAGLLNRFDLWERGILGGVLYALPIAFAGVIFSCLLKSAPDPAAALGSNLLGAVIGGLLEYFSMLAGLRAIALLAIVFYLASYLLLRRNSATPPVEEPQPEGEVAPNPL